jgi:hypothetical protein
MKKDGASSKGNNV